MIFQKWRSAERNAMITRTHALPVVRQCQLLALSRSTAYYQLTRRSAADVALMRRIDALHLDHPFAGARMLRDLLRREDCSIGRRHVSTLMTRNGHRGGDPLWRTDDLQH